MSVEHTLELLPILGRSAGFQTCRVADFQVGRANDVAWSAGLETRDTADLEIGATVAVPG